MSAWLERNLAGSAGGVLPQRDDRRRTVSGGPGALCHAEGSQGQDPRAWVIGQHARVSCPPAGAKLWPVEEYRYNDGRANGPDDRRHVVLRKILAHRRDDRDLLANLDELDQPSGDIHCLPPSDVRM